MKLVLSAFVILTSIQVFAAKSCRDVFYVTPIGQESSLFVARELKRIGIANDAYLALWSVKDPATKGPWPDQGETLVSAVRGKDLKAWMKVIGKKSIGIAVTDHPGTSNGTAILRVGDEVYSYTDVREGGFQGKRIEQTMITEATFMVTPEEMRAIRTFLKARSRNEIVAQFNIRGGPKAGEVINPSFDYAGFTLKKESCAASCTSWMDPKWLAHYDAPEVLRNLAERLSLEPTFVARKNIWSNFRNPNLASISILGIRIYDPRSESMIANNKWGTIRGLARWGTIPDSLSGETKTFKSERIPLNTWLDERD